MAKRVNAEEFEAEVLKASLPVVVEFYSDSCIPCKQLSPVLGGIEDDYEDKLIVVKVNVNFDAELAQKYEVAASPTLLFFKEGKEVNRIRTSMNFLSHRQPKYTRMRNIFSHWCVFGILMISWKKKLRSRIN